MQTLVLTDILCNDSIFQMPICSSGPSSIVHLEISAMHFNLSTTMYPALCVFQSKHSCGLPICHSSLPAPHSSQRCLAIPDLKLERSAFWKATGTASPAWVITNHHFCTEKKLESWASYQESFTKAHTPRWADSSGSTLG